MANKQKRGEFALETLAKILIGVAVLVVFVIGYLLITGKLVGFFNYLKNLFRFG